MNHILDTLVLLDTPLILKKTFGEEIVSHQKMASSDASKIVEIMERIHGTLKFAFAKEICVMKKCKKFQQPRNLLRIKKGDWNAIIARRMEEKSMMSALQTSLDMK